MLISAGDSLHFLIWVEMPHIMRVRVCRIQDDGDDVAKSGIQPQSHCGLLDVASRSWYLVAFI